MKILKNKTGLKAVIVTWGDAWSQSGWSVGEPPSSDSVECQTIGFLKSRTKKGVMVYGRMAEDGCPGLLSFIPAGMVKSVKVLK